jgi:hypothetical protein
MARKISFQENPVTIKVHIVRIYDVDRIFNPLIVGATPAIVLHELAEWCRQEWLTQFSGHPDDLTEVGGPLSEDDNLAIARYFDYYRDDGQSYDLSIFEVLDKETQQLNWSEALTHLFQGKPQLPAPVRTRGECCAAKLPLDSTKVATAQLLLCAKGKEKAA